MKRAVLILIAIGMPGRSLLAGRGASLGRSGQRGMNGRR